MSVVVITGAASGLGWAMTRIFFARGDTVVLLDCNAALLHQREKELANASRVRAVVLDITDVDAVAAFALQMRVEFSGIDVLVNNAGITHRSPAIHTQSAVIRRVMEVDYLAVVDLTLALYPQVEAAEGCIINISSMAGWMPVLGRAGYCAAKSALHQFFETFRAEVKDRGVSVLMVYPSFLDTPIDRNALGGDGRPAGHARSTTGQVRSADWMAELIVSGLEHGKQRIFSDRFSAFAALLYRLMPDLYHRLMRRRFAAELPS
ncbi:MAG TPA: short-chain dehydrogenase [Moraxellaceae bacterium]|nr:short-chain dehydrogenase [Moraxellaceae bacterium]